MLAKVNSSYYGVFGLYNKDTNSVENKTKESAPFEVSDALFDSLKRQGVLIEAGNAEKIVPMPVEPVEVEADANPEPVPEMNLGDMSLKELKGIAKDCGVAFRIGMSKAALIEAIEKALDDDSEPVIRAQLPE